MPVIGKLLTVGGILLALSGVVASQSTSPSFEVASIKRNTSNSGGSQRTLPDGTFIFTSLPLYLLMPLLSPVPTREVVGTPDWLLSERYDIVAKPPTGAPAEQQNDMLRSLFAERMKLAIHVEDQERDTYALIVARSDGRLGPGMEKSPIDCATLLTGMQTGTQPRFALDGAPNRCGLFHAPGRLTSHATAMARVATEMKNYAGRLINDRTGLDGNYSFVLHFAPSAPAGGPVPSDEPDFFTALEEQLGLKLRAEKVKVPVLVIDHIERPTPN